MAQFQRDEKARLRKHYLEQAIAMAMQSRWEDAVTANKNLLTVYPADADAHNRLGKAYTELGRYADAYAAYERARDIDHNNSIAKKNLARLAPLVAAQKEQEAQGVVQTIAPGKRFEPDLFIEETGKTGVTTLVRAGERSTVAKLTAGDSVSLRVDGRRLIVENGAGEYLGEVEPKLEQRLIDLINGGNRYAAAITTIDDHQVKVIIRETYQHPSLSGRVSFPARASGLDHFRPYIKDTALRYGHEEDEDEGEEEGYSREDGEDRDEEPEETSDEPDFFDNHLSEE